MVRLLLLTGCITLCFLPGVVGGFFTQNSLYPWYDTLVKPAFTPPGWVFSPVWTLLYTLMGVSLYLVVKSGNIKAKLYEISVFLAQLFFNGLWSIVFFGMHQIFAAFIVLIFLLVFIILSTAAFYRVSKPAAYLLTPYFIWVCFAAVLNFSLYRLN